MRQYQNDTIDYVGIIYLNYAMNEVASDELRNDFYDVLLFIRRWNIKEKKFMAWLIFRNLV